MYKDFNENIKPQDITLSDLKNLNYDSFYNCYDIWDMEYKKKKENPNKSKEEIQAEVKEEIKKEQETKEKFYQINNEKTKELEQKFKQVKLKVNFDSAPKILRDGKLYTIYQGCFIVYDNRFFNKLYEIKFEENYNITSVIQLDNKDLVFLAGNILIIYRLKEEKYFWSAIEINF